MLPQLTEFGRSRPSLAHEVMPLLAGHWPNSAKIWPSLGPSLPKPSRKSANFGGTWENAPAVRQSWSNIGPNHNSSGDFSVTPGKPEDNVQWLHLAVCREPQEAVGPLGSKDESKSPQMLTGIGLIELGYLCSSQ